MVIITRDELAALWLPWCVARGERTVPIVHLPAEHPRAMQLRVSDLDRPWARSALSWQPHKGGTTWETIERLAAAFRAQALEGAPVAIGPDPSAPQDTPGMLDFGDFRVLHEGCHRASALYVAGLSTFELRLAVSGPFGPWDAYRNVALRER